MHARQRGGYYGGQASTSVYVAEPSGPTGAYTNSRIRSRQGSSDNNGKSKASHTNNIRRALLGLGIFFVLLYTWKIFNPANSPNESPPPLHARATHSSSYVQVQKPSHLDTHNLNIPKTNTRLLKKLTNDPEFPQQEDERRKRKPKIVAASRATDQGSFLDTHRNNIERKNPTPPPSILTDRLKLAAKRVLGVPLTDEENSSKELHDNGRGNLSRSNLDSESIDGDVKAGPRSSSIEDNSRQPHQKRQDSNGAADFASAKDKVHVEASNVHARVADINVDQAQTTERAKAVHITNDEKGGMLKEGSHDGAGSHSNFWNDEQYDIKVPGSAGDAHTEYLGRSEPHKLHQIRDEFLWSWNAYKKHAWGKDELLPVSKKSHRWFGIGLTLLDTLDMLVIMELHDELNDARSWVADNLPSLLKQNVDVNLFECTIRALGGLLSAHALTNEDVFLQQAQELGNRLMPAFNSPSGIPFSDVNIGTGASHKPTWGSDSSTAEVTTVQLEFHRLTQVTGDVRFSNAADRVSDKIAELSEAVSPHHYLLPIFINAQSGKLSQSTISLGARGDSYYEYLLKQWIQAGTSSERGKVHKDRYLRAAKAIEEHLILKSETPGSDLTFISEMTTSGKHHKKMDHLACFYAGVLALGSQQPTMDSDLARSHLKLAEDLAMTCVEFYKRTPTGLAPEIIMFDCPGGKCKGGKKDFYIKPNDEHNLLRPETLESLFILWRVTHKQKYRDWGWEIFLAFRKHCRVASGGYSSIKSVMHVNAEFRDKMESFWLAETLKYLYLLFSDDSLIPLDEYVLNTEAHPFPIKNTRKQRH